MNRLGDNTNQNKKVGKYFYSTKDAIGKGYSSVVYRGYEQDSASIVAIKVIDTRNMKGQVHRVLLNNQIQILRLLNNLQNIIYLHDIIPQKTQTTIITQLCDGGDLAKVIKDKKKLNQQQSISILKQIINGYRGINRFGIVHRDLKPANIFFNQGKVKIADFGFAIRNADLKKGSSYNVGSPVYMPLQALNQNNYSSKSDIWAIGVIFYQMLTGHTPWRAKTETDLKRQIKAISIKSILPTNISKQSSDFLIKALQLNSTIRMSVDEMINHFQQSQYFPQNTSSILRTNYLIRTRAISQEQNDRITQDNSSKIDKNTVTAPKTFRKVSRIKQKPILAKLPTKIPNQLQDDLFQRLHNQPPKIGNLARTVAAINGQWLPDHKKTSSHLLSQIHFCRFLYKLIQRMQSCTLATDQLRAMMSGVIRGKLCELKQMTMINPKYAIIFKRTKQNEKIQEIVSQYSNKYQKMTQENQPYQKSLLEIDQQITYEISNLYSSILRLQNYVGHEDKIILLDYFITMKQLFALNATNDIEYFHKKSKIEAIVEGKPARNITDQHFQAITNKLKLFKIIP